MFLKDARKWKKKFSDMCVLWGRGHAYLNKYLLVSFELFMSNSKCFHILSSGDELFAICCNCYTNVKSIQLVSEPQTVCFLIQIMASYRNHNNVLLNLFSNDAFAHLSLVSRLYDVIRTTKCLWYAIMTKLIITYIM